MVPDIYQITPVEKRGSYYFKREDLFEFLNQRGSKVRGALYLIQNNLNKEGFTTAGHKNSPQINICSTICNYFNKPIVCFTSSYKNSKSSSEITMALNKNAKIEQVFPSYNRVIKKRCRDFAIKNNYFEIPFGMDCEEVRKLIIDQVFNIPSEVKRIVVPIGSGSNLIGIYKGILKYRPDINILGIQVGAGFKTNIPNFYDKVKIINSGYPYKEPYPFECKLEGIKLDPWYEAKCIPYLEPGDCLWIVGLRESELEFKEKNL